MTKHWTPRTDIASVGQPYEHVVPGPPGTPPVARFPAADVVYTDGTVERVPVATLDAHFGTQPRRGGIKSYVVALVLGIPTALLMLAIGIDDLLSGNAPGTLTMVLGAPSALGSTLAILGIRKRESRFRVAALLLTIPPALVILAFVGIVVFVASLFITAGSTGA